METLSQNTKLKRIIFLAIGIIAIVLAIICACADNGVYESAKYYGGDAYTGIQQAAAQTANNLIDVADIVKFGFSSLLAIIGLLSAAYGLFFKENICYSYALNEINENIIALKPQEVPAPVEETSDTVEEEITAADEETDEDAESTEEASDKE